MENNKILYNIYKYILGAVFLIYYRPKFVNKKYIPKEGPIIIAGNHIHLFDQCLPILSTRRMIHYMAKKEYFEGKFAWFFAAMGCIPVDRANTDIKSVKSAMKVLRKDGAIGIFPEGTRNRTDAFLLEFKPGAATLAKKTGAYIVPCGLTGEYKFRSKTLTVRYGEPFKADGMTAQEANEKLYSEVERLMREGIEEEKRLAK